MPKINSQIRTMFYFIDSSLYKFIQPYRKFALFMKKAVITGLMCCDDVIQAPTMYTRPREQFSNRTESHSSNRITRPLRSQQVNRVPALRPQSRQSNVTKISNSTSCHYTAQLHASDLVQLKLKMESISFLLLKKR